MPADPDRIKDLFLASINLPVAARSGFLADACKGDPELQAAVERLLAAHNSPDSRIDLEAIEPPRGNSTGLYDPDGATKDLKSGADERPGPHDTPKPLLAGRYSLVKPIGEGGMGSVWMAQQIEPIKRTVAVKLIKPGMDSRQVLARFAAERQALAIMDHPNIAKVFSMQHQPGWPPSSSWSWWREPLSRNSATGSD